MRDESSTVEVARPSRFDTRALFVCVAVAMTVVTYAWGATHWEWRWIGLPIPLLICALPLASRRARAPLAGVACAAITVWLLLTAYFGGLVFLPEAFVLFIAALPARARWSGTILVGGLATAGFLPQPEPWRVFGWASAIVVLAALLYRAGNLLRLTTLRHRT